MTRVVLAECGGQVWLVGGEQHLDAVLHGSLPDGTDVEYIVVENRAAVFQMWDELSADASENNMPWMINPALLGRLRGRFGPSRRTVQFTPWSVMLDVEAQEAVADAATWLCAQPERRVTLRQFAPADPAPGQLDVQRLRSQLVTGSLLRAGVASGQVSEDSVPAGAAAETETLEMIEESADAL